MCSSEKKSVDTTAAAESSKFPVLMPLLQSSFKEVERILARREEDLKMEVKNLKRDYDEMKKELNLMEKAHGLAELERLTVEDELKKRKVECEEWKWKAIRLGGDRRVLTERKEKAEERYRKAVKQVDQVEKEKNKIILNLSRKNEELKKEFREAVMEKNNMIEALRKELCEALIEKGRTIEGLRGEKEVVEVNIQHYREKIPEFEERVSYLEKLVAASLNVDVTEFRNSALVEAGIQVSGVGRESSVPGNVSERVIFPVVEGGNGGFVLENLPNGVNASVENQKVRSASDSNEGSGDIVPVMYDAPDDRHNVQVSPGASSTNYCGVGTYASDKEIGGKKKELLQTKEDLIDCPKEFQTCPSAKAAYDALDVERNDFVQEKENNLTGCNNRESSQTKEGIINGHDEAQPCQDSQATCHASEFETNGFGQEKENDVLRTAEPFSINTSCDNELHVRKQVVSSTAIIDRPKPLVIVIESDDEAPDNGAVCVRDFYKEMPSMESVNSGFDVQSEIKKNDSTKDSHINLLLKRKRSLIESDDTDSSPVSKQKTKDIVQLLHDVKGSPVSDSPANLDSVASGISEVTLSSLQSYLVTKQCQAKSGVDCTFQISSRRLILSDDSSSDSEDESITDTAMNNLIASLRKCRAKTWKSAAEMLSAFEKDNELCINAVCALYRKKISAERSRDPGLFHFDGMRGKDIAEFLIDGDPKHRLKRTVSDVEQAKPEYLNTCKQLAIQYCDELFRIYHKKEDPFFCQMF